MTARHAPRPVYPWRGFERAPVGCLFEQLIDMTQDMGVAYERSLKFEKEMHVHDRVLLVFPRSGTSMRVRTADGAPYDVTSETFLVVPPDVLHDDHWITDVYDTLALLPSGALVERVASRVGAPLDLLDRMLLLPRTPWLDAVLGEYFDDRVLHGVAAGPRNAALEDLLMMEILRVAGEHEVERGADERAEAPGPGSIVARALRHLEAHLFAEIDLAALCRASGASRSSLLRHFKRELDTTPKAYLLGRRLDEAKRLLVSGRHTVGEVAQLVGYENLGAFSEAFRRRFGESPTTARQGARG